MSDQPGLLTRCERSGVPLLLARLILGGLFIKMGWAKIADPVAFLKLIRQYEMIPDANYLLLNGLAAVLPWIEIFCGLLIIVGLALRGTALLLAVVLVEFTFVVAMRAVGIYQAGDIPFCDIKFDCGCGTGEEFICSKLPQNAGLLALSLYVLLSKSRRYCLRGDLFS